MSALDGTWILDSERSSDTAPVLERLKVAWVLRKLAPTVRPINVIVTTAERATIEVKSGVLPSKRNTLVFDGVTPTVDDFFGNVLSYVVTLEGDTIVGRGHVTLEKEGKVPLELRRRVEEDGAMTLRIIVTPSGEKPLELKRVFKRK
ncbi:MAG: hypothetical protein Q8K32_11385 [Archangium sp.]|nr:hypothetical protein [Archangium sp.]